MSDYVIVDRDGIPHKVVPTPTTNRFVEEIRYEAYPNPDGTLNFRVSLHSKRKILEEIQRGETEKR